MDYVAELCVAPQPGIFLISYGGVSAMEIFLAEAQHMLAASEGVVG